MDDKDRDEARKEAFEFVEIIYKGIANNLDYSPTWKVLERDARIRADERRRCENRAIAFLRSLGPDEEWNEERLSAVILQGTEPAKVSEDIEKDIQTVFAHMLWTDRSREAWSRLVERIKD